RPLDNLVENGFMLVGDAGCQVRPSDGGGIGGSMWAGACASLSVEKALQAGDYSKLMLWSYNTDIMSELGLENAKLEVVKNFMISLTNKQIIELMNKRVIEEDDIINVFQGSFSMSNLEKLKRVWRGKKIIGIFNKIRITQLKLEKVENHYKNYPKTPKEFPEWKRKSTELFKKNRI
ncbi:MAG: NAD(P)/FAD-dependent oxidoreductase, partial [Promethearchaeota archaeon]